MKKYNNATIFFNYLTVSLSFRYVVVYSLICLFGYLSLSFPSFAQTPAKSTVDLTISPIVIELTANPGDTIKQSFRVRNNLNQSLVYTIGLKKITANLTSDFPIPQDVDTSDDFSHWVKIDQPFFTALPAEWQDINF